MSILVKIFNAWPIHFCRDFRQIKYIQQIEINQPIFIFFYLPAQSSVPPAFLREADLPGAARQAPARGAPTE